MRFPYMGERQIVLPPPIDLGLISGSEGSADVEFRVQCPDSRLQIKVSVLFVPRQPFTFPFDIIGLGATYLLQEEDESYLAPYSGYVPLTTIVATPTGTPLPLPAFPGLCGYSREFVTAADAVHGFLSYSADGATFGQWVLQTRFQPYGQRLPEKDWDETRQLCNATIITPAGNL